MDDSDRDAAAELAMRLKDVVRVGPHPSRLQELADLTSLRVVVAASVSNESRDLAEGLLKVIRQAIQQTGPSEVCDALMILFGFAPGTKALLAKARRARAASLLGIRSLKHREGTMLLAVAEGVLALTTDLGQTDGVHPRSRVASKDVIEDGSSGGVILITGTSGTGVQQALRNFSGFAQRGPRAEVVSVERHLCKTDVLFDFYEIPGSERDSPLDLYKALKAPRPILEAAWPQALERAMDDEVVKRALEAGDTVLLTLHAVLYQLDSGRFVSVVNHEELRRQLGSSTVRVITLIDDVYDCLIRLARPGQVFAGPSTLADRIGQLLTLLEWRQTEIRSTQAIANTLAVPHFLFGIKHPLQTFDHLIRLTQPRLVYLAHSISEARKRGFESKVGKEIRGVVQYVSESLARQSDLVIFEPTTIDELRFASLRDTSARPITMDPHWRNSAEDTLANGLLTQVESGRAQNPLVALTDIWATEDALRVAGPEAREVLRGVEFDEGMRNECVRESLGALQILKREIETQINWRDRELVEQSQTMVQIRPFSKEDGSASGGVLEEQRLHARLLLAQRQSLLQTLNPPRPRRLRSIVYHRGSDELRRKGGAIAAILGMPFQGGRVHNWSEDAARELREELDETLLETLDSLEPVAIGEKVEKVLDALSVTPKPSLTPGRPGSVMTISNRQLRLQELHEEIGTRVREALEGIVAEAPQFALLDYTNEDVTRLVKGEQEGAKGSAQRIIEALDAEWLTP